MNVNEFIAVTQEAIAENGFDDYLPTLAFETRRTIHFAVLAEVPPDRPIELSVKEWVSQAVNEKQDYFCAFKLDEAHFKVVSRENGVMAERIVTVDSS